MAGTSFTLPFLSSNGFDHLCATDRHIEARRYLLRRCVGQGELSISQLNNVPYPGLIDSLRQPQADVRILQRFPRGDIGLFGSAQKEPTCSTSSRTDCRKSSRWASVATTLKFASRDCDLVNSPWKIFHCTCEFRARLQGPIEQRFCRVILAAKGWQRLIAHLVIRLSTSAYLHESLDLLEVAVRLGA